MRATEFDDPRFLARLRQGDSAAYRLLVRRFHASLVRFAASIIGSHAQAEEVVQDAWLAVYAGVGRFEARSSLVTWIFSIVMNRARTRVSREGRLVGLGSLMEGTSASERGVPLTAFKPDGHWVEMPKLWDELNPERIVGGRQLWDHVQTVIDRLPAGQRAVILLRDMEGRDAEETCAVLDISAENQRVLLHRARSRIRQEIDALIGLDPVKRSAPARRPRGGNRVARLLHLLTRLLNPAMVALASARSDSRMNPAHSHTVRAALNSAPPSWYGSTPRGLTRWKKMAPDMTPGASAAPHILVQGMTTSSEAAISMLATNSRNGFS
jgi:RNA polymerase sigma-70 factor (ECF subfamily)